MLLTTTCTYEIFMHCMAASCTSTAENNELID